MTDMYRFDLATNDSEEKSVFVNAEQITHWHHDGDGNTLLHFVGGSTVTVTNCAWEMLERIEPEPDYYEDDDDDPEWDVMNIEYSVTAGDLEPGQTVTLADTWTFRNGETVDTTGTGVFDNEYQSDGETHFMFTGMRTILKDGKYGEPNDVGIPARYFQPGGGPSPIAVREESAN